MPPLISYNEIHKELVEELKANDILSFEGIFVILYRCCENKEQEWCLFNELSTIPGLTSRYKIDVISPDNSWWVSYNESYDIYNSWEFHTCPIRPSKQYIALADI